MFVEGWAEWADRNDKSPPAGHDYMDYAPEPPPEALHDAWRFLGAVEALNQDKFMPRPYGVHWLFEAIAEREQQGEGEKTELIDKLAGYLVMEALGHGVAWSDDYTDHGLTLPKLESMGESYGFDG